MRRVILLLVVCLGAFSLKAQRVSDVYSLRATGGAVKFADLKASLGLNIMLSDTPFFLEGEVFYSRFPIKGRENPDSWVQETWYKSTLYGVKFGGGWSYEGMSPVFLNFKASGFAGYEGVNHGGDNKGMDSIELPYPVNNFVYGVVGSPELEVALGEKLSLCLAFSQYVNLGSKYSHYFSSLELGIKFYFN